MRPVGSGVFAKLEGDPRVFVLPTYTKSNFDKTSKDLRDKRLLVKFDTHGFDGMRCDVDGNLYIARHGKGTVVEVSPEGKILREIDVLGPTPSNICFGGPDGRTAYVTEVKHRRLVQFRVDRPGLEWAQLHPNLK